MKSLSKHVQYYEIFVSVKDKQKTVLLVLF